MKPAENNVRRTGSVTMYSMKLLVRFYKPQPNSILGLQKNYSRAREKSEKKFILSPVNTDITSENIHTTEKKLLYLALFGHSHSCRKK